MASCLFEEDPSTLHFVVVSDIHSQSGLAFTKAEIDGILQSGTKIDAILNAGDMTFLSHTGEAEEKESENKIELFKTVISTLEQSGAPHIYIPGNHDPLYTYEAKDYRRLTEYEKSINLHRRVMQLAPHLWLAGIGGSCYVRYEGNSIRDFGFPYKEEFTDDLHDLFALIPEGDQVILMTHVPPATVGTSYTDLHPSMDVYINYGSDVVYDQFCDLLQRYAIVLYVHGHLHKRPGFNWLCRSMHSCCVLNPGAAMGKKLAEVTLSKVNGKWQVMDVRHRLNGM